MNSISKSLTSNSFGVVGVIMLLAWTLLSPSAAQAQDYEAVERRLAEGVVDGELTLRQAAAMMETLRHSAKEEGHGKHKVEKDDKGKYKAGNEGKGEHKAADVAAQFEQWIESVGDELRSAVKAGKLSESDAWKKWHYFKEQQLAPKLKAAVAQTHMNEETAVAIWKGVEMAEVAERLKAAVERGELSEEAARAKWNEINRPQKDRDQKKHAEQEDPRVKQYRAFEAKVRAAVEAGKLSREEAEKELIAARKKLFDKK